MRSNHQLKQNIPLESHLINIDFLFRTLTLILSFFSKSVLHAGKEPITRRNLPILTQIDIYYAFVVCWPLLFDLVSIILYFSYQKSSSASDPVKKEIQHFILSDLLVPDLGLLTYYVVIYFGIFPLCERGFAMNFSGHWLKFSLHNANLIRNGCFHLKLKENEINRAYLFFLPMDFLIIPTTYWSLFWTGVLYHDNLECIVGFLVGSFGVYIFQNEKVRGSTDKFIRKFCENVKYDLEMGKPVVRLR